MRQLDVTRTALALSAATAETVLLVTMPAGPRRSDAIDNTIGAHLGSDAFTPLDQTGSVTLVAHSVMDLDDMRSFMADAALDAADKPDAVFTATMFSGGRVVGHVSSQRAPGPLGIEPEIAAWRRSVAAKAA